MLVGHVFHKAKLIQKIWNSHVSEPKEKTGLKSMEKENGENL